MADGKKSFILYCDWIEVFAELTNEEAGKLVKHIFQYVNDKNPKEPDRVTKLLFTPIKNTLKRDLSKWEGLREDRRNAGKLGNLKRYNPDIYKQVEEKEITASEGFAIAESRKDSQSDTKLAVSVSVSDSVSDNKKEEKPQLSVEETFDLFWDHFHTITCKYKTDVAAAKKYWKALSLKERQEAYRNVKPWFDSIETKGKSLEFVKKGRTYLSDKSYLDEFKKPKPIDLDKQLMDDIDVNHLDYDQIIGGQPLKKGKYAGMYFDNMKRKLSEKPLC